MWLKVSDDFPDDCARAGLSDAAFRTHVEGLAWVMRRLTGGMITRRDVRRAIETEDPEAAIAELVEAGMWRRTPSGWEIVHAMNHQITPEQAIRKREGAKTRKRRQRARERDEADSEIEPVVNESQTRPDQTRPDQGHAVTDTVTPRVTEAVTPRVTEVVTLHREDDTACPCITCAEARRKSWEVAPEKDSPLA